MTVRPDAVDGVQSCEAVHRVGKPFGAVLQDVRQGMNEHDRVSHGTDGADEFKQVGRSHLRGAFPGVIIVLEHVEPGEVGEEDPEKGDLQLGCGVGSGFGSRFGFGFRFRFGW